MNPENCTLQEIIEDYQNRGYEYDGGLSNKEGQIYLQFTHPTKGTVTYQCKVLEETEE